MVEDCIDNILDDWQGERPDIPVDAMSIVLRIQTLEKNLANQLRTVLNKLNMEWWEYDVLSALRRQGEPFQMSAKRILKESHLSPGALTNRIDRLLSKQLVTRNVDIDDRRRVIIKLTEQGLDLVNQATAARFNCAEAAVNHFSESEKKILDQLLKRLLQPNENRD